MLHREQTPLGSTLVIDQIPEEISPSELAAVDSESHHYSRARLRQMATSHRLVNSLLPSQVIIHRDEHGKPSLVPNVSQLSISHTRGLMAVILNKQSEVAVDIEYTSRDVSRIWPRFTTDHERHLARTVHADLCDLFIWSCKECLFKIIPVQGVLFKQHLQLAAVDLDGARFKSQWKVSHPNWHGSYSVNSFIFEPLMVSYIEHLKDE